MREVSCHEVAEDGVARALDDLLGSPRAPREAADPDENDLGQWTARQRRDRWR
ncbi:hypothetical protein ACFZCL_40010 [Streptomyces sp. NPDC008159]|uniref:hypothetical protein n=1 Tax=Streptomyces sp. NPDC008159 TaxID=3364817 RepID=UPI0036E3FF27